MTFEELRNKHKRFVYRGFSIETNGEGLKIIFDFFLEPDIYFAPMVVFPSISKEALDGLGKDMVDNLVFNLGLVEMISYWKTACSPEIVIEREYLNEEQKRFWRELIVEGLGEFFYMNKIDFTKEDLVNLVNSSSSYERSEESKNERTGSSQLWPNGSAKSLVLIGGGKDSAVTLELFKGLKKEFAPLLLNPTKAALDITEVSGSMNPIIVKRTIDPNLLELNKQGYLNGHTPFSAYLAFLGVVAGAFYGFKDIVVSNEASSNEGNIKYLGKVINHQYSKTYEFESKFRGYIKKYLHPTINYYSFLRPLTELQIAKLFSKMQKYHPLFRSCNKGSKTNSWCGNCAKCMFAYLILKPYLKEKTDAIFGKNLLEDETLKPILSQLLREENTAKPFDCVGLVDETKSALYLIDPEKYSYFEKYANGLEKQWNTENYLPNDLDRFLRSTMDES